VYATQRETKKRLDFEQHVLQKSSSKSALSLSRTAYVVKTDQSKSVLPKIEQDKLTAPQLDSVRNLEMNRSATETITTSDVPDMAAQKPRYEISKNQMKNAQNNDLKRVAATDPHKDLAIMKEAKDLFTASPKRGPQKKQAMEVV